MPKARRSRRTLTTLVVLVLLSISIITLDQSGRTHSVASGVKSIASDVFSPLRSGVNAILDPIGSFFAGAVNFGALEQENRKLQATIGQLRQEQAQQTFDAHQLAQIQKLLAMEKLPYLENLPRVMAETVSTGTSNFAATIRIDKGRSQGIALNDPVVGAGGLVGQVVEANHTTSVVRLVTDGQSRVGVTFGKSADATVLGQGMGNPMSADLITSGAKVSRGELMFTNGLAGAVFPPGIPVASVASAHKGSAIGQETIVVQPLADLNTLGYVLVVQWSPPP
ncbi:MAG: rod shape-determining protein MreC [Acidimicrobiales bacterium]